MCIPTHGRARAIRADIEAAVPSVAIQVKINECKLADGNLGTAYTIRFGGDRQLGELRAQQRLDRMRADSRTSIEHIAKSTRAGDADVKLYFSADKVAS